MIIFAIVTAFVIVGILGFVMCLNALGNWFIGDDDTVTGLALVLGLAFMVLCIYGLIFAPY